MYILPRRSFFLLVCGLVLLCIFLTLLTPLPVQGDVGVQPILPQGSSIKPAEETPIQMAAETVVMTVRQGTDEDHAAILLNPGDLFLPIPLQEPVYPILYKAVVDVTADFTLSNPTSEAMSMTVWFPLASALEDVRWEEHIGESAPRIENFQVVENGKPLDYRVTDLPNPQGEDKPPLPWASFPVTFPAGEEVNIQVSYVFLPQTGVNGLDMTLTYIFQTGAGWAGPIGKAELQVNLPYLASEETIGMMPDGGQADGQQVRWTWENLEPGPQDDFSILMLRPERWEELKYWRGIVDEFPDFAQGWLSLATLYERFSQGLNEHGHILQYFGETYQQLGVQAAQEAARLDPGALGPHYELAMLYASVLEQNPSPEELQPVWDELKIMKELNPEEAQALEPNVYDILDPVLYNDATATAEWAAWSTDWANETIAATLYNDATATAEAVSWACWDAFGVSCDDAIATAESAIRAVATPTIEATFTPEPSATPQPLPVVNAPAATTGSGQSVIIIIIVVACVIGVVIVGYLVLKMARGSA